MNNWIQSSWKKSLINFFLIIGALWFFVWSARGTNTDLGEFFKGIPNMWDFLTRMFPPDLKILTTLKPRVIETIQIAVMGTILGLAVAFPLCFFAAKNFMPNSYIYNVIRFLFNSFRGISEIVYALVFVSMVGLGPFPGVLALAVHTTGALGKYFSEAIENMPQESLDAIKAIGANKLQIIVHGIVPDLIPQFFSYVLYYLEHNIRQATILGLVGAGGIGIELITSIKLFKYREVLTILIIMLLLVTIVDRISFRLRKAII